MFPESGPLEPHQRNGDIIKDTTPILQFWSEMQQTCHITVKGLKIQKRE
jgi:hypothetical protein